MKKQKGTRGTRERTRKTSTTATMMTCETNSQQDVAGVSDAEDGTEVVKEKKKKNKKSKKKKKKKKERQEVTVKETKKEKKKRKRDTWELQDADTWQSWRDEVRTSQKKLFAVSSRPSTGTYQSLTVMEHAKDLCENANSNLGILLELSSYDPQDPVQAPKHFPTADLAVLDTRFQTFDEIVSSFRSCGRLCGANAHVFIMHGAENLFAIMTEASVHFRPFTNVEHIVFIQKKTMDNLHVVHVGESLLKSPLKLPQYALETNNVVIATLPSEENLVSFFAKSVVGTFSEGIKTALILGAAWETAVPVLDSEKINLLAALPTRMDVAAVLVYMATKHGLTVGGLEVGQALNPLQEARDAFTAPDALAILQRNRSCSMQVVESNCPSQVPQHN